MKKMFIAAALNLIGASAAFADGLCDVTLSNDDLVGTYKIELGPGTLTTVLDNGGQRVHPVPLRAGTATIAVFDGVPVLTSYDIAVGGVLEIVLNHAGGEGADLPFWTILPLRR